MIIQTATPSDYFCQHQLIEKTESGMIVIRYPAPWYVLQEMGILDHDKEYALRSFEMMRSYTKDAGGSGGLPIDYPTLKDGYSHVVKRFAPHRLEFDTIKALTENMQIRECDVLAIREGIKQSYDFTMFAIDRLYLAIKEFDDKRNNMLATLF